MWDIDSRILPIWFNIWLPPKQLQKFKLFANTSAMLSLPYLYFWEVSFQKFSISSTGEDALHLVSRYGNITEKYDCGTYVSSSNFNSFLTKKISFTGAEKT